jgi:hypothetical protein
MRKREFSFDRIFEGNSDLGKSPLFEQLLQATARLDGKAMRLPELDSNSGTRNVSFWPGPRLFDMAACWGDPEHATQLAARLPPSDE